MVAYGDIWRVNYKSKNRHIYLNVELFFPNQTERLSNSKVIKVSKSQSLVSNSKVSEVILKFPSLLALMEGQTSKPRLQLGSLVDDHPGACMVACGACYLHQPHIDALSGIKVLQGRTINIDGADPSLGLIIKKRFMETA